MKVHEIAKKVGEDNATVAAEFGIETSKGFHFKDVPEADAQLYIDAKVGAAVEVAVADVDDKTQRWRRARFWSPQRRNFLPTGDDKRSDIKFDDWVYTCDTDSVEAAFLRTTLVRDRARVYEVKPEPYGTVSEAAGFANYLKSIIYTGESEQDGPSREGRDSVLAMLSSDVVASLPPSVKSSPKALIEEVVNKVRLDKQRFSIVGE